MTMSQTVNNPKKTPVIGSADSVEETNGADWLLAGSFEEDRTDRRDNAVNDQRHDRAGQRRR